MDDMLGNNPSTQPAVVVDTLEDSQMQDTQTAADDNQLQQTEVGVIPNLDSSRDTSDTAVPSPASTDVTDASGEVASTSQGQKKGIDGTEKVSSKKRKRSKFDVTGDLLDKLIGMQKEAIKC